MPHFNTSRSANNRSVIFALLLLMLTTAVANLPYILYPNSVVANGHAPVADSATSVTTNAIEIKARAKEVVEKLAAGDFEGITTHFNKQLKETLPPEKLEQGWNVVTQQLGSFESQGPPQVTSRENMSGVFITCKFERGSARIEVWFDSQELIAGLWIKPVN